MEHHFGNHRLAPVFRDLQRGNTRAAEKKLLSFLEDDPGDADALTVLIDVYLSEGKWHAALPHARTLVAMLPAQDPRGYFALGCAQARLARFSHAVENLEKARVLAPSYGEVLRNLGWVYCMVGEDEKGRTLLEECITRDRGNVHACVDLAMSYHFRGEYAEATEWISRARKIDPKDGFARSQEKAIKATYDEFRSLKPEEQEARLATINDPLHLEGMRIEMLLGALPEQMAEDDIAELQEEMEGLGLKGILHAIPVASAADDALAREYVEAHRAHTPSRGLMDTDTEALGAELAASSTSITRKKEITVILAAAGTLGALRILEAFLSGAPPELTTFCELAIHECKTLLSSEILEVPKVSVRVVQNHAAGHEPKR